VIRHVHSWLWDGIGGRCQCGADITNEEATMSDVNMADAARALADQRYEIGRLYVKSHAEISGLQAEIAALKADYGVQQLKWAATLAENAELKAENERLRGYLDDIVRIAAIDRPRRAAPGAMLPGNMNSDVPDSPDKSLPSTAPHTASTGQSPNGRTREQMSEDMTRYWQRRAERRL
jgi:hypothetical protein